MSNVICLSEERLRCEREHTAHARTLKLANDINVVALTFISTPTGIQKISGAPETRRT